MIRSKFAAVAAGTILAFTLTAAVTAPVHATQVSTQPVQVKIYLENNNHNPGTVTADCGPAGALLHTALFNDAIGANTIETAVVYAEPANPAAGLGTLVFGPVDVPIAGHTAVTIPFQAGVTYDAVAVAKGDPLPTSSADLVTRLQAKPPTADNSQLFPSGYPADPKCPPPVPNPCDHKPAGIDAKVVPTCPPCPAPELTDAAAIAVVPTCVPATEPGTEPSHARTSSKPSSSSPGPTTSSSPSPTTPVAATTSSPQPTPTGTPTTSSAAPPLAHTGTTVVPLAIGAFVLLAAGGTFVVFARRARQR